MSDLWVALGLVLALEGALYALAPGAMKQAIRQMLELPEGVLRTGGLIAAIIGVFMVWLVRG
ncbi:DUF2065 domain-containing protein [Stappia indica]|uniref:DUF2065 domain-containing protein n=1 Tax=Stappia indica TaxID=538381 RepID=A0A285R593_9HYPH|nr:DUF2065 domain-containing protein [Stappia indica]MCC4243116.1 DUF2065 domain-containing protein [Stappia indica]SOB89270.1 hypothetical protein SAMN05421512_101178 [Stappia indica]